MTHVIIYHIMCVRDIVFFTQFVSIKSIIIHIIHIHKRTKTQIYMYKQVTRLVLIYLNIIL